MTSTDNENESKLRRIMSDDDYVSLFEAEYDQQMRPVDEIGKKQVWNKVFAAITPNENKNENKNENTDQPKQMSIPKWIPAAAVALLIIAIIPLYHLFEPEESVTRLQGMKGMKGMKGVEVAPLVRLSAFSLDNSGKLFVSTGVQETGSTIVFKYDVSKAVALALVMSKDTNQPEIRYRLDSAPPGTGMLLQNKNNTYGYRVEPEDKRIQFCLIAAENTLALKKRVSALKQQWGKLAAESCVAIKVVNEH